MTQTKEQACKLAHILFNDLQTLKSFSLSSIPEENRWNFIRGLCEATWIVQAPCSLAKNAHECVEINIYLFDIKINDFSSLLQEIIDFCQIPPSLHEKNRLIWKGNNALDLMGKFYQDLSLKYDHPSDTNHRSLYDKYRSSSNFMRGISDFSIDTKVSHPLEFSWQKTLPEAIAPFKSKVSDSGFDLTLIKEIKRFGNVVMYDTGIAIAPPFGWYFQLVGRSSISKSGYILANSVGIIDRTYRGSIMAPLIKVDSSAPDLVLPNRLVQIIPMPIVNMIPIEENLDQTSRGSGGFGSTNNSL